MTLTYVKH